jgi:hypothetical protein
VTDHFLQKGNQCWVGRRNGLGEMMMMMGCTNKWRKKICTEKLKNFALPNKQKKLI